jgi:hypothetical protein
MKRLIRIPQPKVPPIQDNMLFDIHSGFARFPTLFRAKVCEECGFSVPTYYRKMRGADRLSNAEKDKIKSIQKEFLIKAMLDAGVKVGNPPGEAA